MKASDTKFFVLLQGHQHYQVPLFQRPYTWGRENWETLWSDLMETYEMGSGNQHFLGSLVTKSLPATPEGVSPFLVIDGQQRLTTLTILLAAIRDAVREQDSRAADRIHELYLTNRYAAGVYQYKLLPTQADRQAYASIINGTVDGAETPMHQAYRYFRKMLDESDPVEDDVEFEGVDLDRLEKVIIGGLEMVSITLGEDDNEYRIFESLNAKGAPLSQADLLRNYFFMRIPQKEHETAYHDVWLPMQRALGEHLEDFFRYELMSYGRFVRKSDVYEEWQRRLNRENSDGLINELLKLSHHSTFFVRLAKPEHEPNKEIARRLHRLIRWDAQTTYPFLLNTYYRYDAQEIDAAAVAEILRMIESFLVRRTLAGIPTNQLNRLFLRLAHLIPQEMDLVSGVRHVLSEPTRRWPTDAEFRSALLQYPLYTYSRPNQRRLILETLEASYHHKEKIDFSGLSIEHVMPQTLTPEWKTELGPTADEVHNQHLHVLGNLTLTGYNPELSNSAFQNKRKLLAESNLQMNREIAYETEWTAKQIEERGRRLADRAIQIWPGPNR